jgi:uncharacterized SAM-binding protein YcdF (DUF218 family)
MKNAHEKLTPRQITPLRMIVSVIGVLAISTVMASVSGFYQFVRNLENAQLVGDISQAEAVVVLTGGANRIEKGVRLLQENHGHRLLISGVDRMTTRSDLGRVIGNSSIMYGCCIDIDRHAMDTRGNAKYTAEWAKLHGFENLIVVTSNYHLPRSLMLMKQSMPDVKITGVPIVPPLFQNKQFWELASSRIIIGEYAKFVLARFGAEPPAKFMLSALTRPTNRSL